MHAVGNGVPTSLNELLNALNAGTPVDAELSRWVNAERGDPPWPHPDSRPVIENLLANRPFVPREAAGGRCPIGRRRASSVQQRPAAFGSKARVRLRRSRVAAGITGPRRRLGRSYAISSDKHGGRHYYLGPLSDAFPDAWIDRGPEGSELSRYDQGRSAAIEPRPALSRRE